MPVCPVCRAEYVEGAVVCSDCQASLADERDLPAAPAVERAHWVRLVAVPNPVAGVMLSGVLEAADIPARLEERTIPAHGVIPSTWHEQGRGDLCVLEEHAERARLLIEEYLARLDSAEMSTEPPGSSDPRERGESRGRALLARIAAEVLFAWRGKSER
jgi:hypothetical protein